MILAILGTSNSVLRDGYTAELSRRTEVTEVRNRSLGLSSSHLCAVLADADFIAGCDGLVLDFAVNEEAMERQTPSMAPEFSNATRSVVALALNQGCVPAVLILPRKSITSHLSVTRKRLHQLCAELSLPVLDAYALSEILTAEHGIKRELLFVDEAHASPWFATLIGAILVDFFSGLEKSDRIFTMKYWRYHQLGSLALSPYADKKVVMENSLRSDSFAHLGHGESLVVPFDGSDWITGISYNLPDGAGILRVDGQPRLHANLNNLYAAAKTRAAYPYLMSALPFPKLTRAGAAGRLCLTAMTTDDVPAEDRSSVFQLVVEATKPPETGDLMLGSFLLRSAVETMCDRIPKPEIAESLAKMSEGARLTDYIARIGRP